MDSLVRFLEVIVLLYLVNPRVLNLRQCQYILRRDQLKIVGNLSILSIFANYLMLAFSALPNQKEAIINKKILFNNPLRRLRISLY